MTNVIMKETGANENRRNDVMYQAKYRIAGNEKAININNVSKKPGVINNNEMKSKAAKYQLSIKTRKTGIESGRNIKTINIQLKAGCGLCLKLMT